MLVRVFDYTTEQFRVEDRTVRTLDRVEITKGLRVWDYDLQLGVIAFDDDASNPLRLPDVDRIEQVWFYVDRDNGGRKLMSDTRVWVRHPTSGERA
jgi:hypothetical protein